MLRSPDTAPAHWGSWVRALWGDSVQLALLPPALDDAQAPPRPVLSAAAGGGRILHLPAGGGAAPRRAQWGLAAAAHAAAHWHFGGPPQPRAGLKPVQLALFGVIEDARIEWLALRELPGLRALWLPFHERDAPAGLHFEALLDRLARSLLDPVHGDPHPWVARARAMFHGSDGVSLALRTPGDVRHAASQLGNDIGQMRLPFNPRSWRLHAAYRDDNQHLWQEDETLPASSQPLVVGAADAGGVGGCAADGSAAPPEPPVPYPEWDHRIRRYRPGWVQVYESAAKAGPAPRRGRFQDAGVLQRRLARCLAVWPGGPRRSEGRAAWGDEFHPAALVDSRVDQRLRRTPDERVYRRLQPPPAALAVLLLLDASASTAGVADRLLAVARACAGALEAVGHTCAVMAFSSRTRHRVDVHRLKHWDERAAAPTVLARWEALEAGGSTRTGAALRHASAALAARARAATGVRHRVLLVTDGQPHDVDVHDPQYLSQDLRRAIAEAAAQGLAVSSLTPQALRRPGTLHLALADLLTIGP